MKEPRFLYIHGANSSKRSFAYLQPRIQTPHEAVYFEYDTNTPCAINIATCQKLVERIAPQVIIGHSLGGIITAYLDANAKKVTIATPFGGSAIANWLPMYSQLMRDVATTSSVIYGLRRREMDPNKFLAIVANGIDGDGFDGSVSTVSQMTLRGPDYRVYDLNHIEVLLDDQVISAIDEWICPAASS